jgi:hypothetical protein
LADLFLQLRNFLALGSKLSASNTKPHLLKFYAKTRPDHRFYQKPPFGMLQMEFNMIFHIKIFPWHFSYETFFTTFTYSGYTLRSEIEAPLITREVLPGTYFLSVIMAADAHA